ncbi:dipeptidyl aminopeptidase/acylaminoacyl peptidase [Tahibacter aquaticus]|uniref:Dipeptidyl aminopeptidase/acylaminoacyl peptidase n=1 Tax=Tahibacter aquaticus TaxID=520092 RepID=A0A4R6Z982_9GAMM|nr:S9 family peptidase [Tahibacter aquaticus]TDR48405.1 dipeptidyl aminopeptidase/acylaminoacyl peptidase [Tahibacter aquaticus]
MSIHRLAFAVAALASTAAVHAQVPLADFARHTQYRSVKISPGGDYLAADAIVDGKRHLALIEIANNKVLTIRPRGDDELSDFQWVGPRRVIYSLQQKIGGADRPVSTGELFGVDADGKGNDLLFGFRLGGQSGESKIKKTVGEYASGEVIDDLRDDDENVLIATVPWDAGPDGTMPTVYRFDVRHGTKKELFKAPIRNASFLTDHAGVVRFSYGEDVNTNWKVMYRDNDDGKWEEVFSEAAKGSRFYPLAFDKSNNSVYWACENEARANAVCTWDTKERTLKPVWTSKSVSVWDLIHSFDEQSVVGVEAMPGRMAIGVLDKNSEEIKTLSQLMQQFPGEHVSIHSSDKEGNRLVVLVESDINPGEFFLLDRKSKKLTPLLKRAGWIDPAKMATMEPVELKSRDGLPLHGYLTRPLGKEEAKNLPLVVMVHGGPYGIRDTWSFDIYAQALASRGYAVLQVNYRGSGGYGQRFVDAGYREWGGKMQDDVTDATQWAIAQGIADAKRICIYGASYGGYAALQGAVREPDLYRCAIGDSGVYDLRLMYTRGDIQQRLIGENYLTKVLGEDKAELTARSPIANLDKLKAKVMLIVGGQDKRVPPVHGESLHNALEKKGVKHEWLYERTEGHGFYDEKNREVMLKKMLEFLDASIGAGASPAAP